MKIAFFELEEWEREEVKETLSDHEVIFFDFPLTTETAHEASDAHVVATFIYSQVTKEVIDQLSNVQLITTMSTGYDHIDIEYAKTKNVVVCNVPTYGENTVAEHTFALILALSRKLYPSIKQTHEQHSFETTAEQRGFDLKGKTLGIVGCGNIGKHVARIAKGFEMNVLVFDLHKDEALAGKMGFSYASLEELFSQSDIISLNVPYNKHTHHIINEKAFSQMKPSAYLVNTARGALVDTNALINALEHKKISGAALDVLEGECEVKEEKAILTDTFKSSCDLKAVLANHVLMKMDNVLITPHNAFNSKEALLRILHTTLDNIKHFPENPINTV